MRVKLFTSACLTLGIAMVLGWAWFLPRPPREATRAEVRAYTVRSSIYLGVLLTSLVGAAVGAYFVIRQAREEYVAESRENFKALIEGTLRDHEAKKTDA